MEKGKEKEEREGREGGKEERNVGREEKGGLKFNIQKTKCHPVPSLQRK